MIIVTASKGLRCIRHSSLKNYNLGKKLEYMTFNITYIVYIIS